MSSSRPAVSVAAPFWVLAIFLLAVNLRAPITGLAPVLSDIQTSFGLSTAQAGMLTTLPLLVFAAISPFGLRVALRFGIERPTVWSLGLITVGVLIRSFGGLPGLYLGTALMGVGIAVANVLLPGLVKRDFPNHVTSLTGLYVLAMGCASAVASAAVVPASAHWGWPASLSVFALVAAITLLAWLPLARSMPHTPPNAQLPTERPRVWRVGLAWQVAVFFTLNSAVFYVFVTWLPAMLTEAGYSATEAGNLHGLLQLASAVPGLLLAPVMARVKDHRWVSVSMAVVITLSLAGLRVWPEVAWVWVVLYGISSGAAFILGLIFVSLRVSTPMQAAALSGMAQCLAYVASAIGPTLAGRVHDSVHSWTPTLDASVALSALLVVFGWLVGRDRQIPSHT